MNHEIVDSISHRISGLELSLRSVSNGSSQSVIHQMCLLKKELDTIYTESNEFATLTGLIDTMEPNDTIPDETERLLLLKHPAILQAYNNLIQLSNMDLSHLINYSPTFQDKIHDLDKDRRVILGHEDELRETTKVFHQTIIKNMMVFERYVAMVLKENEFWLQTEKRMGMLEKRQLNKERKAKY